MVQRGGDICEFSAKVYVYSISANFQLFGGSNFFSATEKHRFRV